MTALRVQQANEVANPVVFRRNSAVTEARGNPSIGAKVANCKTTTGKILTAKPELGKVTESSSRSAAPLRHAPPISMAVAQEGGRLPRSDHARTDPVTPGRPLTAARYGVARAPEGRAAESRSLHTFRNEPPAAAAAGGLAAPVRSAREDKSRLRRRHSFDSTVDYKPIHGHKATKKHEPDLAQSRRALYEGPRGLLRDRSSAEHATRHAGAPTSIKFSLADIQPREPGSQRGATASGTGSKSRPSGSTARRAAVQQYGLTRTSTVPYGPVRQPGLRDDSTTFDFDDFHE